MAPTPALAKKELLMPFLKDRVSNTTDDIEASRPRILGFSLLELQVNVLATLVHSSQVLSLHDLILIVRQGAPRPRPASCLLLRAAPHHRSSLLSYTHTYEAREQAMPLDHMLGQWK
jgi:hypothetical protein